MADATPEVKVSDLIPLAKRDLAAKLGSEFESDGTKPNPLYMADEKKRNEAVEAAIKVTNDALTGELKGEKAKAGVFTTTNDEPYKLALAVHEGLLKDEKPLVLKSSAGSAVSVKGYINELVLNAVSTKLAEASTAHDTLFVPYGAAAGVESTAIGEALLDKMGKQTAVAAMTMHEKLTDSTIDDMAKALKQLADEDKTIKALKVDAAKLTAMQGEAAIIIPLINTAVEARAVQVDLKAQQDAATDAAAKETFKDRITAAETTAKTAETAANDKLKAVLNGFTGDNKGDEQKAFSHVMQIAIDNDRRVSEKNAAIIAAGGTVDPNNLSKIDHAKWGKIVKSSTLGDLGKMMSTDHVTQSAGVKTEFSEKMGAAGKGGGANKWVAGTTGVVAGAAAVGLLSQLFKPEEKQQTDENGQPVGEPKPKLSMWAKVGIALGAVVTTAVAALAITAAVKEGNPSVGWKDGASWADKVKKSFESTVRTGAYAR